METIQKQALKIGKKILVAKKLNDTLKEEKYIREFKKLCLENGLDFDVEYPILMTNIC